MGTMGIAMILAPAIGPTLSGYIVQNYDWNVMFYGMFFIGIIAIVIGLFWFKLYQSTTNPKQIFLELFIVRLDSVPYYMVSQKLVIKDGAQLRL